MPIPYPVIKNWLKVSYQVLFKYIHHCWTDFEEKRLAFMSMIKARPGLTRIVNRSTSFHDVLKMYEDEDMVIEFPTFIQSQDELAIDAGGVTRGIRHMVCYVMEQMSLYQSFILRQTRLFYPLGERYFLTDI